MRYFRYLPILVVFRLVVLVIPVLLGYRVMLLRPVALVILAILSNSCVTFDTCDTPATWYTCDTDNI